MYVFLNFFKKIGNFKIIFTKQKSQFTPFCDIIQQQQQNDSTELQLATSVEKFIIDTLAMKLNFHPKYIHSKQEWGKFVNGSWTGSVGALINEVTQNLNNHNWNQEFFSGLLER